MNGSPQGVLRLNWRELLFEEATKKIPKHSLLRVDEMSVMSVTSSSTVTAYGLLICCCNASLM